MTNQALVKREEAQAMQRQPDVNEFAVMKEMATMLVKTSFLPQAIKTPEQALAIMLTGREIGVGTMASLNQISVIQGKPTVSPQLMLALSNRSGQLADVRYDQSADGGITCTMKRKGRTEHSETFGPKEASAMQLSGKDNYKKQAATMYKWRAVAACARVVFPDVILGLYTPDEMGADVNDDGELLPAPKENVSVIDVLHNRNEQQPEAGAASDFKAIMVVCDTLKSLGDSAQWNKNTIREYAIELFDDDTIKTANDLSAEQRQILLEDLQERIKMIEAELSERGASA